MRTERCGGIAEFIGVLANAYRIRILCVLSEGECSVNEIAEQVELPSAHVSSHLRVLYDRGYVVRRRDWRQVFYSLRNPRVRQFLDMAAELAGEPLVREAAEVVHSDGRSK